MKIVIAGQADLEQLREFFDADCEIPRGHGGIPPVHEIRMLLDRGHEIVLVTLDSTLTEEVVLRSDRLTIHIGPCRTDHPVRNLYRQEREYLTATIRSINPDVVHAHWTYEYALAALDSGYPVVVTIHDAPLRVLRWNLPQHGSGSLRNRLAQSLHWTLRSFMAWRVARNSRFNIAVSPHTQDHFTRVLRCRGDVQIVPNLMNPVHWSEHRQPDTTSEDGAGRELVCAAILGTWSDLKNGKTLLEALAMVRASGTPVRLQLVGHDYGPHGVAARWARRHNLASGVEFLGPLPNLAVGELLESADILTHPSREEACGMVLAEAQLAQTAVIGGISSGGVPWTLDYGMAGVLVDIESADKLAGTIVTFADDLDFRNRMAAAGNALALRRYEPVSVITEVEKNLERCIDASRVTSHPEAVE